MASKIAGLVLVIMLTLNPLAMADWDWTDVHLAHPEEVKLAGREGEMLRRGVDRIANPPYTADWVLSDVSFAIKRIFTNYSGDVSGRYIELAALTSPAGRPSPAAFLEILKRITDYQKSDGHFGVEVDLRKELKRRDPPIPMFWGNARLLVGLVTAGQIYKDERLMASARKLGDFYVGSVGVLCTPERLAELQATGSGGDSITCCYFPAIEGLAMLYRATHDERYLTAACAIADYFRHFDKLPIDHSHGNLCAYRGILMLYEITGQAAYLKQAEAKWEQAVREGYVWPIGGIGEHWYVFHPGDEGCSESDWLRFNLDLWHLTGRTRYLDMTERLLVNQYPANQSPNGGFGWRSLDGEKGVGPVAMLGEREWNFCCSFHGPLGLHFLKAYLATGGAQNIRVTLPLSFTAPVEAGGARWNMTVRTTEDPARLEWRTEIVAEPQEASNSVTLWMATPAWARSIALIRGDRGQPIPANAENGYVKLSEDCTGRVKVTMIMRGDVSIEQRRFKELLPTPGKLAVAQDVTLRAGPQVLMAAAPGKGRLTLLATVDGAGRTHLLRDAGGTLVSAVLPGRDATEAQIHEALATGRAVSLRPWVETVNKRRQAFAHDVVFMPEDRLSSEELARFAKRAADVADAPRSPVYGDMLERRTELWSEPGDWKFLPAGLLVPAGDIGLLDCAGYKDYRFEFNLTLPKEGRGVTGWVVRAQSESDCLMFQLQSSDTGYNSAEWKTSPNTLRPHVRRGGEWTILEPVKLQRKIMKGETHHIATECRGDQITVWLDNEKIYSAADAGFHEGTVGFRANGSPEQGFFKNITLIKIE